MKQSIYFDDKGHGQVEFKRTVIACEVSQNELYESCATQTELHKRI